MRLCEYATYGDVSSHRNNHPPSRRQRSNTTNLFLEISGRVCHFVEQSGYLAAAGKPKLQLTCLRNVGKYLIFVCLYEVFLGRDGRVKTDELHPIQESSIGTYAIQLVSG